MSQINPPIPDPEHYWPQAEQMLDAHFRRKRRRRMLALLILLLIGGGASVFLLNESTDHGDFPGEQKVVQEFSNPVIPSENKDEIQSEAQAHSAAELSGPEKSERNGSSSSIKPSQSSVAQSPFQKKSDRLPTRINRDLQTEKKDPITVEPVIITLIGEEDSYPRENADQAFSTLCEDVSISDSDKKIEAYTGVSFDSDSLAVSNADKPEGDLTKVDRSKDTTRLSNLPLIETRTRNALSLILTAGPALTQARYSANNAGSPLVRRDKEEVADILPEGSLQVSLSRGRWDFRAGLGMSVWGETVKYSPYSRGEYLSSRDEWQPYSYTATDTDSAYIYGMLFFLTNTTTVNDSQLVNVTDTLNGVRYDPSVLQANGRTRQRLLQIPVEAVWNVSRGRIGFGVSAGLTFGFLMSSTGSYLVSDESGVRSWESSSSTKMIVQAGGGLEISYRLNDHFRFSLAPNTRFALTPIREPGGADKTYHSFGLRAGVAYRIK